MSVDRRVVVDCGKVVGDGTLPLHEQTEANRVDLQAFANAAGMDSAGAELVAGHAVVA